MTFGGDVAMGGASRLEMGFGGAITPSSGFDLVNVDGVMQLGGALRLSASGAVGGAVTLPIIRAGELLGSFASLPAIGAGIGAGVLFNGLAYDYNRDEVLVSLVDGPVPGDFNRDGSVDGGDLLAWQVAAGSNVDPGFGADGNGDGVVDGADLTVWNAAMTAAATQNAVQTDVPEPGACGLAMVAVLTILASRRGKPWQESCWD
jgi:hypothetical protein